jgi:hypothetical protein
MGKAYVGYGHHYQRYPVPGYVDVYDARLVYSRCVQVRGDTGGTTPKLLVVSSSAH